MRDTVVSFASAQKSISSPPIIRCMANALYNSKIDLLDKTLVVALLLYEGWSKKDIKQHVTDAVLMVMMRRTNERRGQRR